MKLIPIIFPPMNLKLGTESFDMQGQKIRLGFYLVRRGGKGRGAEGKVLISSFWRTAVGPEGTA